MQVPTGVEPLGTEYRWQRLPLVLGIDGALGNVADGCGRGW